MRIKESELRVLKAKFKINATVKIEGIYCENEYEGKIGTVQCVNNDGYVLVDLKEEKILVEPDILKIVDSKTTVDSEFVYTD